MMIKIRNLTEQITIPYGKNKDLTAGNYWLSQELSVGPG